MTNSPLKTSGVQPPGPSRASQDSPTKDSARAIPLWATSNERELFVCVLNSDLAANALMDLDSRHFPSERAQYFLSVCRGLLKDGVTLTPETLSKECERQLDIEAAEIALLDLGKLPKRVPKSWADRAFELAEALIENGPILYSTDTELDEALGEIEWLWPRYIPKGFVAGFVGEQETGKSTLLQSFLHRLLVGGQWPDGEKIEPLPADQKLLWIDTDGNLPLFHARLKAWGMPRGRFIFPADSLQELSIDNPKDWKWIEAVISEFHPPAIVIDALSGTHTGKENDSDSMKLVMKKLHYLAQKYKVAIIVIHHLNKPPIGVPAFPITISRLRGSTSISQYCRSIIALTTPDPARPEERRLDVIKLNLGKKPEPVGYVLSDSGPLWGRAPEPPKKPLAVDDAMDFLTLAFTESSQRPAKEIEDEAIARGIGDNALKNARKMMGITTHREGGAKGRWFLRMPEKVGGSLNP